MTLPPGSACTADSFGGFSVVGHAYPLLAVLRGSTLAGGGGWTALYGGPTSNASASAIAVRGNTTVVVGSVLSSTPSESFNQVVLGWRD